MADARSEIEAEVLEANAEFYAAFEARDFDAMSDLWLHDEQVACTHPGWATLHGWAAVAASWFALFTESEPMQFITTGERVRVHGESAWVTVDENLIADRTSGTVAAVNVFVHDGERWRMVLHHGGAVTRMSVGRT